MKSLTDILGEDRNQKDTDLNDVIQKKLAAGISVHELYLREMGSLKRAEFRIVDIRKHLLLLKETIDKFSPQDDINAVIPYRLDSEKEKSKSKGKRKVDQEHEQHKKTKGIQITGSSLEYGLKKHSGNIFPEYLVQN